MAFSGFLPQHLYELLVVEDHDEVENLLPDSIAFTIIISRMLRKSSRTTTNKAKAMAEQIDRRYL
jgi:hypothetical protein